MGPKCENKNEDEKSLDEEHVEHDVPPGGYFQPKLFTFSKLLLSRM